MKREERNLHREGNKEAEEEPLRSSGEPRDIAAANRLLDDHEIEAANLGIQPQDGRQHEHRADHRKKEILYSGVDFASVAVHSNQKRHRNQRGFPEEVEQEQVESSKDADQGGFEKQ